MKKIYLKYITSLLLFGSNGIVASSIFLSSTEIVLTRTLIGSLTLLLFFVLSKRSTQLLRKRESFAFLFLSGAAMGGSWIFLYKAYTLIGVGLATLIYYCGPVLVMVLSPFLFHEKITWGKVCGFFAVLTGIYLVNGPGDSLHSSFWGIFCGIMAAFLYAIMIILNKKASGFEGLENPFCQLSAAFLTTALFLGISQGISISIDSKSLLPILILGIVNTGIGCCLYFSSIRELPVQTVAVCGYLEPLSALVFSVLFLGETLNFIQLAGVFLVVGGALFAEISGKAHKEHIDADAFNQEF